VTVDFSHYIQIGLDGFANYLERGGRLTDEMWLDVLRQIKPPLVSMQNMTQLVRELDPAQDRPRGRPKGNAPVRILLADRITRIARLDIPTPLLRALVDRLRIGNRYSEFDRGLPIRRRIQRLKRTNMIRGLYSQAYSLLDGKMEVEHPILGRSILPNSAASLSRSEQSLVLAQIWMREVLWMDPPSIGRMRNLVPRRHAQKFMRKT
jgi:hypothetical protein